MSRTVVIIGAGPAGLTAALELLRHTDLKPVILEASDMAGGISRTVEYHGNRMDIGGHRFFSKSPEVMSWWNELLPLAPDGDMLERRRVSRIYFLRKFFDYPVSLSLDTFRNLGPYRTMRILRDYVSACISPIEPEKTLEDFFINRFGRELYGTFFEDYTEKVWGRPCSAIGADWGAQRVKGVSVAAVLKDALRRLTGSAGGKVETSLISSFWYPKYGPGELWEKAASEIVRLGGEIRYGFSVVGIKANDSRVTGVIVASPDGSKQLIEATYVMSSMPIKDLTESMNAGGIDVPDDIRRISEGLCYRDFMTVGILADKLEMADVKDDWIYIQERDVRLGRLQVFNNWSPYMAADSSKVWLGLEYFCDEGDELWNMPDGDFKALASRELSSIGIVRPENIRDSHVIRMKKAYPAYFGTYDELPVLRGWMDGFQNLFLIGRNGQHRYNNMDHSMLTAMNAVEAIRSGSMDKASVWNVNTEHDYHEGR